jgi:hypothetical protein
VSLTDHISYLCVLASRKDVHCLDDGRGGKSCLSSALTMPHAFGCTGGSCSVLHSNALGFNRDI